MTTEQIVLNADAALPLPPETLAETEGEYALTASPAMDLAGIDITEAKGALEAALMATSEPLTLNDLKRLFDNALSSDILRALLDEMRSEWHDRSVELALVASGYRFRVKPVYQKYLDKLNNDKPPKYSRAVLETLAIIVYRQPVTRADIEDIRGVQVSPHILKTLQDRGWVDEIGHKEVAGRPALFATTRRFLDDLNLRNLEQLPPLHELQASLDMTPAGVALTVNSDAAEQPNLALPGLESSGDAVAESVAVPTVPSPMTEMDNPNALERNHG